MYRDMCIMMRDQRSCTHDRSSVLPNQYRVSYVVCLPVSIMEPLVSNFVVSRRGVDGYCDTDASWTTSLRRYRM